MYMNWPFVIIMALLPKVVTAAFKTVCLGEEAVLNCRFPHGVWKYISKKASGSTSERQLTEFLDDRPIISPDVPEKFKRVLRITQDNKLVISNVTPEHNGSFKCMQGQKRFAFKLIAIMCKTEICMGDKAIIECSIYGHARFQELVWKRNKTIILKANSQLITMSVNDDYSQLNLSRDIPGALVVPIHSMDVQQFTCELHRVVTKQRSSVIITPKQCVKTQKISEKNKTVLKCPYYSMLRTNPHATKIMWTKNSRKIVVFCRDSHVLSQDNCTESFDGKITIKADTERDSGKYSCTVVRNDGVELAKHSVTIEVMSLQVPGSVKVTTDGRTVESRSILIGVLALVPVLLCIFL